LSKESKRGRERTRENGVIVEEKKSLLIGGGRNQTEREKWY